MTARFSCLSEHMKAIIWHGVSFSRQSAGILYLMVGSEMSAATASGSIFVAETNNLTSEQTLLYKKKQSALSRTDCFFHFINSFNSPKLSRATFLPIRYASRITSGLCST